MINHIENNKVSMNIIGVDICNKLLTNHRIIEINEFKRHLMANLPLQLDEQKEEDNDSEIQIVSVYKKVDLYTNGILPKHPKVRLNHNDIVNLLSDEDNEDIDSIISSYSCSEGDELDNISKDQIRVSNSANHKFTFPRKSISEKCNLRVKTCFAEAHRFSKSILSAIKIKQREYRQAKENALLLKIKLKNINKIVKLDVNPTATRQKQTIIQNANNPINERRQKLKNLIDLKFVSNQNKAEIENIIRRQKEQRALEISSIKDSTMIDLRILSDKTLRKLQHFITKLPNKQTEETKDNVMKSSEPYSDTIVISNLRNDYKNNVWFNDNVSRDDSEVIQDN